MITEVRTNLAAVLEAAGPDRPTLCEGWRASDLLAHLLLRETRPDVAAGIALLFGSVRWVKWSEFRVDPATARHLAYKFAQAFVADVPPAEVDAARGPSAVGKLVAAAGARRHLVHARPEDDDGGAGAGPTDGWLTN